MSPNASWVRYELDGSDVEAASFPEVKVLLEAEDDDSDDSSEGDEV